MSPASKINPPSRSETDHGSSPEPPTTPGVYWFQSETTSKPVMVDVRLTNGELTVWWLTRPDEPVAKLKGRWHGPIPPSMGPGSY
jgi:hypothetical protein